MSRGCDRALAQTAPRACGSTTFGLANIIPRLLEEQSPLERDKPTLQGTHSVETVHAKAQRPEGSRWSSPAPPRALNHTARLRRLALAHWCAVNKFPNQNTEKPVLFTENLVSVLLSVTSTEKTTSRNLMTRKHTCASGAERLLWSAAPPTGKLLRLGPCGPAHCGGAGAGGAGPLRGPARQLPTKATVPAMRGPDARLSVPRSAASLRGVKAGVRLAPALGAHSCSLRGCPDR